MKKVFSMISDDLGKVLHDKATRGITLSAEEQVQLQSWYDEQDAQEVAMYAAVPEVTGVAILQAQIDATLTQLISMTRRIQAVMLENKALRQEIEGLRRQLIASTPL
jgi:hypothetical protein